MQPKLIERPMRSRLARLKIEQRLSDRILTDAQLVTITTKLQPFAGQEYKVTRYWDLKESLNIANRIRQALSMGGWKYFEHGRGGSFLIGRSSWSLGLCTQRRNRTNKNCRCCTSFRSQ